MDVEELSRLLTLPKLEKTLEVAAAKAEGFKVSPSLEDLEPKNKRRNLSD